MNLWTLPTSKSLRIQEAVACLGALSALTSLASTQVTQVTPVNFWTLPTSKSLRSQETAARLGAFSTPLSTEVTLVALHFRGRPNFSIATIICMSNFRGQGNTDPI